MSSEGAFQPVPRKMLTTIIHILKIHPNTSLCYDDKSGEIYQQHAERLRIACRNDDELWNLIDIDRYLRSKTRFIRNGKEFIYVSIATEPVSGSKASRWIDVTPYRLLCENCGTSNMKRDLRVCRWCKAANFCSDECQRAHRDICLFYEQMDGDGALLGR